MPIINYADLPDLLEAHKVTTYLPQEPDLHYSYECACGWKGASLLSAEGHRLIGMLKDASGDVPMNDGEPVSEDDVFTVFAQIGATPHSGNSNLADDLTRFAQVFGA